MQLILDTPAPDYAAWKAAFDAQAEAIANAGLTTLQIWRATDAPKALVLFEVHNRTRAESWLAQQHALGGGGSATFVETA